jgi:hypothetical protein
MNNDAITIDEQIRADFFQIAREVGCEGTIGDFVSAINNGGNNYPLFLLTPLVSSYQKDQGHEQDFNITMYFFDLYQTETGETPNEEELWQIWGRVAELANKFRLKLYEPNWIVKYVLNSSYKVERNAFALGTDETVFVKVNCSIRVYSNC